MVALSTKKNCGRLRNGGCKLRPVKQHEIRWNGSFRMVKQYLGIRQFLSHPPWNTMNAIVQLLPTPIQELRLAGLYVELKKFEMVSKGLQRTENTLYDARYALNFIGEKHPAIKCKVGVEFTDYLWRPFESGIVKIQGNNEAQLNELEKVALEPFLLDQQIIDVVVHEAEDVESYEALMKKARREIPVIANTKYINTSFVKADTNICERLFSVSRKVWREDRKAMYTSRFELLMLLKCNRELWDERLVFKCRTNPRRRPLLPAPTAGGQVAVPIVAPVVAPVGVPAMAAAELAAFIAELDNEVMGDYNNVFLRDGVAAHANDHDENDSEDDEDEEEEAMDDDEEDWSDDEFDDAEFANV